MPEMTEAEKIMSVHELVCPDCGGDLTLIDYGGIQSFIDDCLTHLPVPYPDKTWTPSRAGSTSTIGMLQFECGKCGRKWETYQNVFGDWTLGG